LAERISKTMGITGRAVITRLLGIILAALAVQFIIDGISALAI
jgi:multiple antibiotic resistance protein